MLNFREKLHTTLLIRGLSLRKLVSRMKETGIEIYQQPALSKHLRSESIKLKTANEILDFHGYKLIIVPKDFREPKL